jgi:hypothetical protein
MTIEEIKNEIDKALAGDRTLMLKGYKSSDGTVKDHVVVLLPEDGYNELRPKDADTAEWAQALIEQGDSFSASLNPDKPVKEMQFKNPLVKQGGMHFYKSEIESGEVQTVIIKNLQVLSTTNHTPEKEAKEPKGNIPRHKNLIKSKLPISQYVGQFNLSPDKVELVRAVHMP